jgi:hypothetical protein
LGAGWRWISRRVEGFGLWPARKGINQVPQENEGIKEAGNAANGCAQPWRRTNEPASIPLARLTAPTGISFPVQSRKLDLRLCHVLRAATEKCLTILEEFCVRARNCWRQLAGKPRHSAQGFPESIGTLNDMGFGPHVSTMKSTEAMAPGGKVCLAIGFVQRFNLIVHEEADLSIRKLAAALRKLMPAHFFTLP